MNSWITDKFHQWFNFPPEAAPDYLTDTKGRRFYYYFHYDPPEKIAYLHFGKTQAELKLIWNWNAEGILRLADIYIRRKNFRGNGLGSAMFQQLVEIARLQDVTQIVGHIVNNENRTDISRQQNFYRRQGCRVDGQWFCLNLPS